MKNPEKFKENSLLSVLMDETRSSELWLVLQIGERGKEANYHEAIRIETNIYRKNPNKRMRDEKMLISYFSANNLALIN